MPDLSKRPTRYAVTAIAAVALVAGTLTSVDVRVGQDAELARAQRVAADLQEQLDRSEAEAEAEASTAADSAAASTASPSPTGAASSTTAAGGGRPAPAATTVIRQVVAGTQGGSAARAAVVRSSSSPTTAARTSAATTSCLTQPDQESAQAVFVADRARHAAWDGDGDGLACEQLKSRGTTPTRVVGEPAAPPQEVPARPTPSPTRTPSATPTPSSTTARPTASPTPTTTTATPRPPAPTTPALPVVPAASEIIAAGHFFGLATATTEETDVLEAALGRQVTMTSFYKGWDTDYDTERVTAAWRRGQVPVMTWESRPLEDTTDTTDYSLARIVDGDFDDYLVSYARQVDALGLPVVIRFDHEMNGDWYRWTEALDRVGGTNAYGNAPGSYVAAWRHVHDVFEAAGAGDEVIWTWSPNRVDNIGNARFRPMADFYPGDEYVDWVGMTGYHRPEDVNRHQAPTFAGTFGKTLGQLRALAPDKHILIAEMGATEDGGDKPAWTASFFTGLAAQPDVVGFTWFNYAISEKGHTNDWRLDSTDEVFAAAKTGLTASQYGLDVGKRFTLKPIGVTPPPEPTPEPTPSPSSATPDGTGTDAPTATPAPSSPSGGTPTTTPAPSAPSTTGTATTTGAPPATSTSTGASSTPVTSAPSATASTTGAPAARATATPTTAP